MLICRLRDPYYCHAYICHISYSSSPSSGAVDAGSTDNTNLKTSVLYAVAHFEGIVRAEGKLHTRRASTGRAVLRWRSRFFRRNKHDSSRDKLLSRD